MGRLHPVFPSACFRPSRRFAAAGVVALGLGMVGCGPNVQHLCESHIRFEHCYRLDLDPKIVPSHRKACWEDWLLRFIKDQTRDRLDYARRRVDSLAAGERQPMTLDVDLPTAATAASAGEPASVPTSAHAPPPARMPAPANANEPPKAP